MNLKFGFHLMTLNMYRILFLFLLLSLFSCASPGEQGPVASFDLEYITQNNPGKSVALNTQDGRSVLTFTPDSAGHSLLLADGGSAWRESKYLVMEVSHDHPYSAILYIDFFRQGEEARSIEQQGGARSTDQPRISPKIGVLPYLPAQVIFPLSHLDGQDIFLDRFPRQLKGTILGSRLDPADIDRVSLRLEPFSEPDFQPSIRIFSVELRRELPAPLPSPEMPVVDQFGQWTARDWPGKIPDEATLKTQAEKWTGDSAGGVFPQAWSRYGGWKEKRFEATGFFRTEHDGQRWWLVDPEGYAFLSMGMDCVGPNANGVLEGQEDLFQWLPPREDTLFQAAYSESRGLDHIDFYKSNLIRVFGSEWRSRWENMTVNLLKNMRFNTIGNWSDVSFARRVRMPYVLPLSNFPTTELRLFRDFPDVFSETYEQNAQSFAQQLKAYRDDPFLIGYFLRNEPHWAFGYHNLAFEMLAGPPRSSATRRALIQWLQNQYEGDIDALNESWQTNLPAFAAIDTTVFRDLPSEQAETDLHAFSEQMVQRYVNVVCDAVEAVDPNHLNLGMRYAWISSDLLYKAGERFDVFSINGYSFPGPPATEEIARRSGKPILIGEYHFGAIDRGLPSTGIQGVDGQEARGTAYRYYTEQGFARPEVIALHYFQWNDQPVFGRFDGENYNIGFIDICLQPYPPLQRAARLTHERVYEVAQGRKTPFDSIAPRIPQIFF